MIRSSSFFLLLPFLVCIFSYDTSEKLYVRTDASTGTCQNRTPCYILSDYASNSSQYLNRSNTELIFLEGVHYLEDESIVFQNLKSIVIRADGASEEAEIVCAQKANQNIKQYSGFSFQNITDLEIKGLIFTGCSIVEKTSNYYFSRVSAGLYMTEIINLTIDKVTVQNSTGYGLFLSQIYGISNIQDSIFQYNNALDVDNFTDGGNVALIYQTPQTFSGSSASANLTIKRSKFLHGRSFTLASGLLVMLLCSDVKVHMIEVEVSGNQAENSNCAVKPSLGGNLGFLLRDYDSSSSKCTAKSNSTEITILKSVISLGGACYGGGMFANFTSSNKTDTGVPFKFTIADSVFSKNRAQTSGAAAFMQMNSQVTYKGSSKMLFNNCTLANNQLMTNSLSGVAITITSWAIGTHHLSPILTFVECVFSKNYISTEVIVNENTPKFATALYVSQCMDGLHINDTRFDSNAVGAISLIHSSLTVSGEVVITNNTGYIGGGLALREVSYLIFTAVTNFTISYNHASYEGGGIFVQDEPLMLQNEPCFYQADSNEDIKIKLIANSAAYGSQLYGGRIETCIVENTGSRRFVEIFELDSAGDNDSFISSKPEEIRFCHDNTPDFNSSFQALDHPVYSGERFNVSVAFIGQLKGITHGDPKFDLNLLSSEYHLKIISPKPTPEHIREKCITYTVEVYTNNSSEQLEIQAVESHHHLSFKKHVGNISLNISITPTPLGFVSIGSTASDPYKCIERPHLSHHHFDCSVRNHEATIERWPPYWLGYSNSTGEMSYVLYYFCPEHYCHIGNSSLLSNSEEIALDAQCANNHSGVLCGQCKAGFSVSMGSSVCLNCSHVSVGESIGITLGLASVGTVFVASLYFLNLATTFQGKLSGFHFYMNVIYVYWEPLHRETKADFTYVFVSFANLVFGCNCCIYNGLGMIGRTWLQFLLVIYLWCLVGVIILASKYFKWINKWKGDHTVPVMAALMYLSHTSLSLAVIHSLSAAQLKYETANSTFYHTVLLYDGNIRYFDKWHIPLFIAGCLFGLIGICFILLVLCVQPLQKYSNFFLLRWVNHLKPFFDACTHPHITKTKYQFWNGFLWLARVVTYFAYAARIRHDSSNSLNVLSIMSLTVFLTHVGLGGVYTKRSLNFSFAFYVLNLLVLSVVVKMMYPSKRTKLLPYEHIATVSSVFIGLAIFVFLATVTSHLYNQVKNTKLMTVVRRTILGILNRRRRYQYQVLESCAENSDQAAITSSSSSLGTPQNIHPPLSTTYREPQLRDYDSI